MNPREELQRFLSDDSTGTIILGTQACGRRRVHPYPRCPKVLWAKKNGRGLKTVQITEDLLVWWSICLDCTRRMKDVVENKSGGKSR